MRVLPAYLFLLVLISLSSFAAIKQADKASEIELQTVQTEFIAGHKITLRFSNSEGVEPLLYCTNSYGSTLIRPYIEGGILNYSIPKHITQKKGIVSWKLIHGNISLSGQFTIKAKPEVASMETYIGPPSIQAGGTDYTMMVVIPTDALDNPLPEDTTVKTKHQFLSTEISDTIKTKHLVAYKNIYSKKESGRMLVSSECLNINSKEFTINVMPAIPVGFSISAKRPHGYADGNQITTFETSILKDKDNNIVSDGTFVTFSISNEKNNILKTYGSTINGIATAKMIHPDYGSHWQIQAYVIGMAQSNILSLNYKQAISDFEVQFSENNRVITIGPLKSFMDQMIPDGLSVKLQIYKNNTTIESIKTTSANGYAQFKLKPDLVKNDDYTIVIQTAGLEKTFKNTTLW
ncbi:hypothetical protein [Psychroserpens mesophilus]|uniref:hypothetical protein n=1 Tax=Psychroserpens mesophilus TaxID=325473 RepID=UPI00058B9485|nr:hypothetical protein [Psychroserpens mesophilus]